MTSPLWIFGPLFDVLQLVLCIGLVATAALIIAGGN